MEKEVVAGGQAHRDKCNSRKKSADLSQMRTADAAAAATVQSKTLPSDQSLELCSADAGR